MKVLLNFELDQILTNLNVTTFCYKRHENEFKLNNFITSYHLDFWAADIIRLSLTKVLICFKVYMCKR